MSSGRPRAELDSKSRRKLEARLKRVRTAEERLDAVRKDLAGEVAAALEAGASLSVVGETIGLSKNGVKALAALDP